MKICLIKKNIYSMLDVLDFYEAVKTIELDMFIRKMGVIFEIDNYIEPKMQLVGIEGKRSEVDKVYNNLKEIILQ